MGKELTIFGIAFFLLFIDVMLLHMGFAYDGEVEELSIGNLISGETFFSIGSMLLSFTPFSIFFIALNILGIAIVIMILRGV